MLVFNGGGVYAEKEVGGQVDEGVGGPGAGDEACGK
jgi:hypothetical protein